MLDGLWLMPRNPLVKKTPDVVLDELSSGLGD